MGGGAGCLCFTNSVSSQLFLQNTITNMIAPVRGECPPLEDEIQDLS